MDDKVSLLVPPLTRRGFLQGSLTAAALAGVAPIAATSVAGAQSSTPVSMQLGWFANAQMAGDFTAIGKGYFKDAGLDVKIAPGGPSIDPVGVVASGSTPIGNVASIGVLVSGRSRGVPLKAFASAFQRHPFAFFFLRESGIKTPADFAGKTIGIQGTARPLLDAVLAKYHVPREKVNVIIIGGTTTPLLTKQADVVTGWVRSWLEAGNGDGEAAKRLLSVYAAAGVNTRASVVPIEQVFDPGDFETQNDTYRRIACEAIGAVEPTGRLRIRFGGGEVVLLDLGASTVTGLGGP